MHTLSSTDTMVIQLANARNTSNCHWRISYWDAVLATAAFVSEGSIEGDTNGVSAVQMLSSPDPGNVRHARAFTMVNTDSATITAMILVGGLVYQAILRIGDVLQMTEKDGWFVTDATGSEKMSLASAKWGDLYGSISDQTDLSSALASRVFANATITASGSTNKIVQYDAKGLVVSGADATTANIPDTTDKRYITDAQRTLLGNTTGTNTGDQTLTGLGGVPTTRTVAGHALSADVSLSKSDVGLGNVDNTSDANKPVSTATQTALNGKVGTGTTVNTYPLSSNVTLTTSDVADSTDKRYVTDAQRTVIGNTSGANTGDETLSTIKTKLGITTLSGSNTGDETAATIEAKLNVSSGNVTALAGLSGTNTGDETLSTIKTKLGITTLSGSNTGDETAATIESKLSISSGNVTALASLNGTNTGDETLSTIKTKLGITTLSGSNTGDETAATIESKLGVSSGNVTALASLSGSNTGDQTLTGLGGVPTTRNVAGHALSADVTITTADVADSTNNRYVTDAEKALTDRVPLALHTGVIDGCVLSINAVDNTKLDLSAGHTQYVDDSNPNSPIIETLTVAATTITPVVGASGLDTLFKVWGGIARTQPGVGTLQFSNMFFGSTDRRRISVVGTAWAGSIGSNVIAAVSNYPSPAWGAAKTLEDLFYGLGGSINVDGNYFSAHTGQLTLDKSVGHAIRLYGAASISKDDPNSPTASAASPVTAYRYWAASGTSYGNALSSTIDPNYYDNAGTRTATPAGKWTIQRVYWFPSTAPTPIVAITYGQALFDTLDAAKAAANTQVIVFSDLATNGFFGGLLRARIYVQQGATDLSGAYIENMNQFVAGGAGSSSGGSVTDHATLAHLDFASAGHTGFAPSNSPTFIGTITRTGTGTPAVLPGNALEVYDTVTGATLQTNIQNLASDGSASTDIVATANNGSNTTNFVDMGINSSTYNDSGYTSGGPDDAYLLSVGGNLAIISGTASKSILFFTGGTTIDKLRATLADSGLSIVGTISASNLSGTNSGDETLSTIKTKLGITTLSGSNTGDETAATIESKLGVSSGNVTALASLSGSNTGDQILPTDATIVTTDVTTNNASTTKHGWQPKATAPSANQLNVVGIANGETVTTYKTIIGSTLPTTQAFGDAASHGTSIEAAAADHKHAMPATPTASTVGLGNVTNNAQTQASIVPNTAPSAGQILVGNAGGTAYAPVAASGDVAIASTGAMTIQSGVVSNAKLATVGAYTLKGNATASTAAPTDITMSSASMAALPNLSGTNTGNETATTIKTALGITTLSGSNTGDQTVSITGDVTASGSTGALSSTVTKINGTSLAGLGTGLLKNTTGTGVPSIAVSGTDIKTINGTSILGSGDIVVAAGSTPTGTGWRHVTSGVEDAAASTPTATQIGLANVTNDAQTKATIVPNTAPGAGQVLVGNAGGTAYAPVTLSGDGTIASTGALTVTKLNGTSLAGLGTGLLKNTTGTGIPSIAVAGDLPGGPYVPQTTTVNGHALSGNVSVTTTDLSLNNLTNDVQTKAAIVPNTAPSAGQVLVGNAGGTAYAPVTTSGDVTIASTGAQTIAAGAVTLAKQANLAANSIQGNNTGSSATPLALTAAQVKTLLAITPTDVGLGSVTNNAQTQASIVPNTAPSAGQILVGNAGGTAYAPVAASGDVAISSTGAHTIQVGAAANIKAALGITTLSGSNTGDQVVPALSSTTPTAETSGIAGAVGTGTTSARADHVHALPTIPTIAGAPAAEAVGSTQVTGASGTASDSAHVHAMPTAAQFQTALLVQPVGNTSTATAGSTTTLTNASTQTQTFTGTLAQTVVLPAANTLAFVGWFYCIVNQSTYPLTIQANGGTTLATVATGGYLYITCTSIGSTTGTWQNEYLGIVQPRGTTTTAMAGGTTTLTMASSRQQIFTGSGTTAQTVVLPDARTLPFIDWAFEFDNVSTGTGALTIQTSGAAQLVLLPPSGGVVINCTSIATQAGTWDIDWSGNDQPNGTTTIATAGSTTTMTAGFPRQTIFTGTATQTVVLPDARTLPFVDWKYEIDNLSSRTIVIQTSGGTLLTTIAAGGTLSLNCTSISTQAGTWQFVSPSQLCATLPSLPIMFPGLDVYGHSWDENPVNSSGGYGPALQINSNDFAGRIFANACGITGDRYVNHAVSSSQLTGIGAANGHFARVLTDTFRSRQAFPFVRSGNATILGWGINDIGNNTSANQALVRSTAVDILTVLVSTLRASVIYSANGGGNLAFGANFSNAAAAAVDWTSGLAKQCTAVDSAGTSTVTFTIPVGYQGEPICFRLGGLQAGSLVVTWGGTAGVTGTTTLSSRSINSNSIVPNRITNLTGANAGQTITCAVTTISGSTFYFDGVVIEAFKPMPVLICNVPRLPQRTITWSSGAGVTTGVNTSFTDASIQFSGTGGIYDVGATLTETDAQGAFTGNTNTVSSVTNATTVVLGSNAAAAKTSIKYTITRQLRGYSSSLYWTTNTNFTSATVASHAAADTDITNWNTQVVNGVAVLFDSMVQVVDLDGAVGQDVGLPASGVYTYWNVDGGHLTSAGQMKRAHAIWQAAANLVTATADTYNLINLQEQGSPSYYNAPYRRIIKSGQIITPDQGIVCPTASLLYTAVAGDAFAFPFYVTEAAQYWGNVIMDQANAGTSIVAVGLYTDTGAVNGVSGYPQYLLKSTANFTMNGSASVNTVSAMNHTVYPGIVWLVVVVQSTGTASTFYTMYGNGSLLLPGWNGAHLGTATNIIQPIAWKVTGVAAGGLPSVFPTGGVLAGAAAASLGIVAPLIGVTATIQ